MTPFEALYGRPPLTFVPYTPGESKVLEVDKVLTERDQLIRRLREHLGGAQQRMATAANRHRREMEFSVGDLVLLKLQPYRQHSVARRRTQKLARRYYSPFRVLERVGNVSYSLELPEGSRIHPFFHVALHRPYYGAVQEGSHHSLQDEFVRGQPISKPVRVHASRKILHRGKLVQQYLVEWSDGTRDDATWEPCEVVQRYYPDIQLEDKVFSQAGGSDTVYQEDGSGDMQVEDAHETEIAETSDKEPGTSGGSNGLRIHQLKTEMQNLRQKGQSVEVYYNQFITLWNQLYGGRDPTRGCRCGAAVLLRDDVEKEKTHTFLLGLDDEQYGGIRSQILGTEPIPDINRAYSLITQEEHHHSIVRARNDRTDAMAFAVTRPPPPPPNTYQCTHCGKSGHTVDRCYMLIGFPNGGRGGRGGRGGCGSTTRGKGRSGRGGRDVQQGVQQPVGTAQAAGAGLDAQFDSGMASAASLTPDQPGHQQHTTIPFADFLDQTHVTAALPNPHADHITPTEAQPTTAQPSTAQPSAEQPLAIAEQPTVQTSLTPSVTPPIAPTASRPQRVRRAPPCLSDYVCNIVHSDDSIIGTPGKSVRSGTRFPLTNFVNYDKFHDRQEIEQMEAKYTQLLEKSEEKHSADLKEIGKSVDKTLETISLLSDTVSNTMEIYASDSQLQFKEFNKVKEQIASVTVGLQKQMSLLQMDIRSALAVASANQVVIKDYLKVIIDNQKEAYKLFRLIGAHTGNRKMEVILQQHNPSLIPQLPIAVNEGEASYIPSHLNMTNLILEAQQ
ncbi:unnamed protein product [Cuscuta campestris]|uniref:CCHC-type domain-containing protein n=1 Tax=Cuscuta campestris TaxID=132261 RepID=A0A484NM14_9ASTE|nr:unnamed protein product [Cuscuta campestris]